MPALSIDPIMGLLRHERLLSLPRVDADASDGSFVPAYDTMCRPGGLWPRLQPRLQKGGQLWHQQQRDALAVKGILVGRKSSFGNRPS